MKKIVLLVGLVALGLGGATMVSASGGPGPVNGMEQPGAAAPMPLFCWFMDEVGNEVTELHVSNPFDPEVNGYWIWFGGPTWTHATVTMSIQRSGLPEKVIVMKYRIPGGYEWNTVSPFAIADWGDVQRYGTVTARVVTDTETTTCTATILPDA